MADRIGRAAPHITVEPAVPRLDEALRLGLIGCTPHQPVTLRASTQDATGRVWTSEATFETDASGAVLPAGQAPRTGTYATMDPMGLFWSMTTENATVPFVPPTEANLLVRLRAEQEGQLVAERRIVRRLTNAGVTSTPVNEAGLVGVFCRPSTSMPVPGVLLLGGSSGGLEVVPEARVLASHGVATFALAYFGLGGLPAELREIPLEYFATALAWLQAQPGVQAERIAVMGASRGGELALLLGATYPVVRAVIAVAPSALVHNAVVHGGGMFSPAEPKPAWTLDGQPMPFLPHRLSSDERAAALRRQPVRLTPLFLRNMEDPEAVAAATIPVERIQGPVLHFSGEDDQLWPASALAELIIRRFDQHRHSYPVHHHRYTGAGHGLAFHTSLPYIPTTVTIVSHPVSGLQIDLGGTAQADAAARVDAWHHILTFLDTAW